MRTSIRGAVLACLGLLSLAGCGTPSEQSGAPLAGSARQTNASLAAVPAVPLPTDASAGAQLAPPPGILEAIVAETAEAQARACKIQGLTLETGRDVFMAQYGVYPESEAALIADGLLGGDVPGQDLLPDGTLVAVNQCVGVGLPEADLPDPTGENHCRLEERAFLVAREAFRVSTGAYPATEDDMLGQFMDELSVDFDIAADGSPITALGSPCPAPNLTD